MVRAKELELEDRHGRLQTSLREKMIILEDDKTAEDKAEEERLLEVRVPLLSGMFNYLRSTGAPSHHSPYPVIN